MTLYGEPRVWLEQFPLGERVPFSFTHLGIEYPGEVVRAETWSAGRGLPLNGEVYFRVVLLRQRRGGLEPVIQDPRIAVCLPAAGVYRRRSQLATEVSTTRETQAVYLAQQDTEAELIRQTLRRRLDELEDQLLGEDSVPYAEGQVITQGTMENDLSPQPANIFGGMDPNGWFSRLAGWLLAKAYPQLPLDLDGLRDSIGPESSGEFFAAFFRQPGCSPAVMEQLGLGLGLTGRADEDNSNRVFELIPKRISQCGETISWRELHRYLAHEIGLTGPLATMFLLIYLHGRRPDFAVELLTDHELALFDGRRLLTGLITPDLVPALGWDNRLSDWAVGIVFNKHSGEETAQATSWNDSLQHLAALSPRLGTADTADQIRAQESILLEDLGEWTQAVIRGRELVNNMEWTACQQDERFETLESLDRLSAIRGDDFPAVYDSIVGNYLDFRRWEADLATLRELAELAGSSEEISSALRFIRDARVSPVSHPELSVDRQGLLASLSLSGLAESRRRNLDVLMREVAGFKLRYLEAYRAHHESLSNQLPVYSRDLELAQLKLKALELLNTVVELGEPVGAGLADSMYHLGEGPSPCMVDQGDIQLDSSPWCGSCSLTLDYNLPTDGLARLIAATDMDLGAKNRQLSALLVEQILQGKQDERLDDLLKIVQASDLSALSNTMTAELVGFIQGIVS